MKFPLCEMLYRSCVQVDRGACAQGLNNADTCRRGNLGQVWGEASVIPRRDQSLGCARLDALNTKSNWPVMRRKHDSLVQNSHPCSPSGNTVCGRSCGENMTLRHRLMPLLTVRKYGRTVESRDIIALHVP